MRKLLVDTPVGRQDLFEVGEGGGYFDPSRVIWDEREDGALPAITLGGMVRSGGSLVFNQARMDQHTQAMQPPVPQEVTMRQARQALILAGKLDTINQALQGMRGTPGELARAEWEYSITVQRNRPLVLSLGAALGMSSADLDALFVQAATL